MIRNHPFLSRLASFLAVTVGAVAMTWGFCRLNVLPPLKVINFPARTKVYGNPPEGTVTVTLFNYHFSTVKVLPLDPDNCGCNIDPASNWVSVKPFSSVTVNVPVRPETSGGTISRAVVQITFEGGQKAFVDRQVILDR